MTIVIARHGETDGNAARILQRPDAPLNGRGMRQAEQLAQRLFDHFRSHPVQRFVARAYDGGAARCLLGDND